MNTNVEVEIVKTEKVRLKMKDVFKLSRNLLYEMYDWGDDYYISKDKTQVVHDVEYHTSHSFDITETVREATERDFFAYKLFKDLYEFRIKSKS